MQMTLSYIASDLSGFINETVIGSHTEIERAAIRKSWVVSRGVNVLGSDGFPDETFGDWGCVKCQNEDQFLRTCMVGM